MRIAIIISTVLLLYTMPLQAITWTWVGKEEATTLDAERNYHRNSGAPKNKTNIKNDLDSELLDNFYGMVPEMQQVSDSLLNSTFENISIRTDLPEEDTVSVKVTFLNEGAGYTNSLGYFIYDTDEPPTAVEDVIHILVFPNGSKMGSGGKLKEGDQVDLDIDLAAGKSIGFFINSNGWDGLYGYQKSTFLYGQPFYTLTGLNPSVGLGQRYHVVLSDDQSVMDSGAGSFVYGFEDILTSGGDRDYNDLIISVQVNPVSAVIGVEDAVVIQSVSDAVTTNTGTLAFEDNWPLAGDYDFNDAVLGYEITRTDDDNETVKTIQIDYEIKAVGATFHNALAVSIPGLTEDMIESVTLAKTLDGVTSTITSDSMVTTLVSTSAGTQVKTYSYPLIKDASLVNDYVSFTLSEDLFEELSTFNSGGLVYETYGCMYRTESQNGCPDGTTASTLSLLVTLSNGALSVSELGDMPFDHYIFGTHKNDIYRYGRGTGSSNDWFTKWAGYHSGRDSSKGPGPGRYLEIHKKNFGGSKAFEDDYSTDSYPNAKIVDAQNDSNGANRFISRELNIDGSMVGNLPWVLDLPEGWLHPKERVDINRAYPDFIPWIEDNSVNTDWYQSNIKTEKVYND